LSLPAGGGVGTALIKASATDDDVKWSDGESFVTVGYRGGFSFTQGGGLFWRGPVGDEALRAVVLREAQNGLQPRIANSDGTSERDIIDTSNGDARYVRIDTPPAWATRVLGGGLSGTGHYRMVGGLVHIKFNVNKGTSNVGDGQHVMDVAAPAHPLFFLGQNALGAKVEFQMTALGQIYVRSGGASTSVSSSFTYPLA
jgi:hypothetical protein